jgi:hypothetical protein
VTVSVPRRARPFAWRLLLALAALSLLLPTGSARALPADAYRVDTISQPGATSTSVRGVDAMARVLGYWNFFSQPHPLPFGSEPDDEGYFLWESGTTTPFTIPGLTNVNIWSMNVAGAMWGSSDEGSFVYRDGNFSIVQSPATDVTIVLGVDGAGRVYGVLGNYPPGVDPNDPLIPIHPVSNFVWENGTFSDLNLLLADATLHGVRQDGVLWGSNAEVSFLQDGVSLTILDHPDFDYTGLFMLSSEGEAYGFGLTAIDQSFDSSDFFWDPVDGFRNWPDDQDLPGTNLRPYAMNEAEVFWGFGGAANTAFVAVPVPEPSTALLLALGLAMLRGRSTRD